ncbi:acetyltransferase [Burkholderiales bacterium JOSHI_001]|nr:acetyltransferase [Burkholderiales bacterium JOSHI_001]
MPNTKPQVAAPRALATFGKGVRLLGPLCQPAFPTASAASQPMPEAVFGHAAGWHGRGSVLRRSVPPGSHRRRVPQMPGQTLASARRCLTGRSRRVPTAGRARPAWASGAIVPASSCPASCRPRLTSNVRHQQNHNPAMRQSVTTRPIKQEDYAAWRPLWDGYNEFYGRKGDSALPEEITSKTWSRFFDEAEPVCALVAEENGSAVGLVHYLFHRSTTRLNDVCYLQDLFTVSSQRGKGIGRALIQSVYEAARAAGCTRVYWQTQASNSAGRALYDKVAVHSGFIVYAHEL